MDRENKITLTESGSRIVKSIYTRNKTLTKFFIHLGVNPKTAEKDACKIEHDISDESFSKIKKYLTTNS